MLSEMACNGGDSKDSTYLRLPPQDPRIPFSKESLAFVFFFSLGGVENNRLRD